MYEEAHHNILVGAFHLLLQVMVQPCIMIQH